MKKRILIVEDDADILMTIAELLEMEGYQTLGAANGKEALEILEQASPLPDLIILDYMMPIMNGAEFRAEQKKNSRIARIPVLLMTADAQPRLRGREADAEIYVRKPLDIELFLKGIQTCLDSSFKT